MILGACTAPWDCKCFVNGKGDQKRRAATRSWLTGPGEKPRSAASTPSWLHSEERSPQRHREHKGMKKRSKVRLRNQRSINESQGQALRTFFSVLFVPLW